MLIKLSELKTEIINNLNGGEGSIASSAFEHNGNRIVETRIHVGSTIGLHQHPDTSAFAFVISGEGKAICDGEEEILVPGVCQYCPKGSFHTLINTGTEDLVMYTVVAKQ